MPKKKTSNKKTKLRPESSLPIIFILLVIGFVILFVNINRSPENESYSPAQLKQSVNSTTLLIPETDFTVTLTEGKAEFLDKDVNGYITMSSPYFSIETSEGYDTFAVMTYNTGGSGEFVAIGLFHTIEDSTVYANSYVLGDRITVENIEKISGDKDIYEIKVDYLDRDENTPMTAKPTVKKTVTLQVNTHKITTQPQE
jgi:hypothetical protein